MRGKQLFGSAISCNTLFDDPEVRAN